MEIKATFENDAFAITAYRQGPEGPRTIVVKQVASVFTHKKGLELAGEFEKLLDLAMRAKLEV